MIEDELPCLIAYGEKTGGSYMSIAIIADMCAQGAKVLLFTAYPMTKNIFLKQIEDKNCVKTYVTNENQLKNNTNQVIVIESGNEALFLKATRLLEDVKERIVLVKNVETFSSEIINSSLKLQKIIISGDVEKSAAKEQISQERFKTIIVFSNTRISLPEEPPKLEKYTGYLWSKDKKGVIKMQQ